MDERVAEHEHVHPRPEKAVESLLGAAYDRLVLVERCIEDHGDAGEVAKRLDESVVARVGRAVDGLQASRSVDVSDGGDRRPLLLADLENLHHEGNIVVFLEPVFDGCVENRRRKRAEALAPLYLGIEDLLHVGATRVANDRTIAERPRPPLHPALKPSDDFAAGDGLGRSAAKIRLVVDPIDDAASRRYFGGTLVQQPVEIGLAEPWAPIDVG